MEIGKKTIALLMILLVFVSLMGTFLVITRATGIQSIRVVDEGDAEGRVSMEVGTPEPVEHTGSSTGQISLTVIGGNKNE